MAVEMQEEVKEHNAHRDFQKLCTHLGVDYDRMVKHIADDLYPMRTDTRTLRIENAALKAHVRRLERKLHLARLRARNSK